MVTFPDFLIVGAMKAGTTTLAYQLRNHPQVAMPPRELQFFSNRNWGRGPDWYQAQLEAYRTDQTLVVGEKSPAYSYMRECAERIHQCVPDVKIIWSFRDPVARSYSNYLHAVRRGVERRSFESAVRAELSGKSQKWFYSYLDRSRYAEQVKRFAQFFPLERMAFVLFEELRDPELDALGPVLDFLGVSKNYTPPEEPQNQSLLPRFPLLLWAAHRAFGPKSQIFRDVKEWGERGQQPGYPAMKAATRDLLKQEFRQQNEELGALIGRDLSIWG